MHNNLYNVERLKRIFYKHANCITLGNLEKCNTLLISIGKTKLDKAILEPTGGNINLFVYMQSDLSKY